MSSSSVKASYHAAATTAATHKSKKSKGSRNMHGRIFPKASIRTLIAKEGVCRVAAAPTKAHRLGEKAFAAKVAGQDTYAYVDQKLFLIMEKVLHDAEHIAAASKMGTIKERHIIKALEPFGAIGLASEAARRRM